MSPPRNESREEAIAALTRLARIGADHHPELANDEDVTYFARRATLPSHLCPACHKDPNEGRVSPVTGLRHLREDGGEPSPEEEIRACEQDLRDAEDKAEMARSRIAYLRGAGPWFGKPVEQAAARVPDLVVEPPRLRSEVSRLSAEIDRLHEVCRDVMRERGGLKAKVVAGREALARLAPIVSRDMGLTHLAWFTSALAALSDPAPEASRIDHADNCALSPTAPCDCGYRA